MGNNAKECITLPFPQEIQNEIFASLDPFSLVHVAESGIRLSRELSARAIFGNIWSSLLSMQNIQELTNGLTEQGNAFLIGHGLQNLHNNNFKTNKSLPCAPIHIILTWVHAKKTLKIKQGHFLIPEHNIILWIKKPDILFDTNGITAERLGNYIHNNQQTKILYFKGDYNLHSVHLRSREPEYSRPFPFQFEAELQHPCLLLCLQSWKAWNTVSEVLPSPSDNLDEEEY